MPMSEETIYQCELCEAQAFNIINDKDVQCQSCGRYQESIKAAKVDDQPENNFQPPHIHK